MAAGRFLGDRLRARYRARRLIVVGALIGGAGLLAVALATAPGPALVGFAVAGIGYALLVPVFYSEGARLLPERPETGISVVATAGISGLLLGPPLIGWISGWSELAVGLGVAAGLTLLVAAIIAARAGRGV